MLLKLMFFLLNLLNLFINIKSYNYLTSSDLTYNFTSMPQTELIKDRNWPYIGFSCSVKDGNNTYFISSTKTNTYYNTNQFCSFSKKIVQISKFNIDNELITGNLIIGQKSNNYPNAQGNFGSDDVTTCGLNKEKNILYYMAQNLKKCSSNYNYDANIVRVNLTTFSFIDRTILRNIANIPTFSEHSYYKYEYLNWPSTSVYVDNYGLYIGFRGHYTGIIHLNISTDNIFLINSLQKTYENTNENQMFMTETSNTYTDRIKFLTKSFIIEKNKQIYFLEDTGYSDCKIIRFNYTEPFNQNNTEIIVLNSVNHVTDIEIDPISEKIYVVAGLLSSELYQYSYSFNKLKLNEQCGTDFLKFNDDWGVIWNIELDYQTGYIYAIITDRHPNYGIIRIKQKDLTLDIDEIINFKYIYNFNQYSYYQYIPYMNITSLYLDKGKLVLFPNKNTYSNHKFIVIHLSGCAPGRGKNNNYCEICSRGKHAKNLGSSECKLCELGKANNILESIECTNCDRGKYTSTYGKIECSNCKTGFYSNQLGISNCKNCSAGKYSITSGSRSQLDCLLCDSGKISIQGSTECQICEFGKYSLNGEICMNCPKGKFSSKYNIDSELDCELCPQGKYNDETGLSSINMCKDCKIGTIGLYEGAKSNSTCYICPPGKYRGLLDAKCKQCPNGYISLEKSSSCSECDLGQITTDHISCIDCSAGKYRGPLDTQCEQCSNGYISSIKSSSCIQCNLGRITTNFISCIDCSAGKYRGPLDTECINCNKGYISEKKSTECIQCDLGKYENNYISCIECSAGKYSNVFNINNDNLCKNCIVGKYNSNTGSKTQNDCIDCPQGKYGIIIGATSNSSCIGCNSGKFATSSSCQTCAQGFISLENSQSCSICELGKYSDFGIECIPCPAGKFNNLLGIYGESNCKSCPIAKYNPNNGSSTINNCIDCSLGTYSTSENQINSNEACIPCPAGRYRDANINPEDGCSICPNGKISIKQSSNCQSCDSGKYVSGNLETDHIYCKLCDAGKYNQLSGGNSEESCIPCPKGKYNSELGSNLLSNCLECSAGLYNDELGSNSAILCKNCPAGKYRHVTGGTSLTDCYDCIPGRYSESFSIECNICEKGKYSNLPSSIQCSKCPDGTYSDTNSTLTCKNCIENAVQSLDATYCECSQNTYFDNGKCLNCPFNFICPKGSTKETIIIKPGYWRYDSNTTDTEECRSEYACIGGKITNSSDELCREGHKGPLCDVCLDGWAKNDGGCFECKETNQGRSIALTIIIPLICIFVLIFLIKTANPSDNKKEEISGVTKILMNYAQVFSMASSFDINWPKLVSQLFETTKEFSSPRVSFYSSDCTIGWKYYDKLIIYLSLPIVYIIISMFFLFLISMCYIRDRNQKLKKVSNTSEKALFLTKNPELGIFFRGWAKTTIVIGTFLAWPTVMKHSLSVINCKQIGNIYYLVTDLSIQCYTTQHYTYSIIAYIAICLYGIGIPFIGYRLLYTYRYRLYNSINKYSGAAPLSFLFLGYRDTRWYYEFIVMGRKLGLILISVFLKEHSRYQMISANILIQISFFLHVFLRPYDNIIKYGILCNKLESLSLLALVVTLSCGMFFGTKSSNYNLGGFELALVVILFLANIIVFTYFMINLIYLGFKTIKLKIKHLIERLVENKYIERCCKKCCSEDKIQHLLEWSQNIMIDDFGVRLINDDERFIYKTYIKQRNEKLQLLNHKFDHIKNNKVSLKLEKLRLKIEIIERERCWQNILNNRLYLKLKKIIMLSKRKLDDDDVDKIEKIYTLFIKNGLQYNENMKQLSGKELESLICINNQLNEFNNNQLNKFNNNELKNNIEMIEKNSITEIII